MLLTHAETILAHIQAAHADFEAFGQGALGVLRVGTYQSVNTRESVLLEELVHGQGKQPRVIFRSDDNGAVQGMVAAGLGVALVPALAVDVRDPGVVALPFGNAVPPRVLCLVWHRDRYR